MLNLDDLMTIYPQQTWLELSVSDRQVANTQADAQTYTHQAARSRAYLNSLCLNAVSRWLAETADLPSSPHPWLPEDERPAVWELVNGCALTLANRRWILIPDQAEPLDELRVEQEWLDLPEWAGHYYLAVQISPNDDWLRIVGYTTYEQLHQVSNYDPMDQTYCLPQTDLIEHLNVLWVAQEFSSNWQPVVDPLTELSHPSAQALIAQLSQVTDYSPRRDVAFEQWAALIANSFWRRSLYQKRLEYAQSQPETPIEQLRLNLSPWFQQIYPSGWQFASARGNDTEAQKVQTGSEQITLGEHRVLLTVKCEIGDSSPDTKTLVTIQIRPAVEPILPNGLRISLSFEDGSDPYEQEALPNTGEIELPTFFGSQGGTFSITLNWAESRVIRAFAI